jgi:hypothetical protein
VTLPPLVLFVHVTAVLTMFAALSFEALSLFHLRRVSSLTEVRRWIDSIPHLPWVARGSLLLVFLSGVYLTVRMEAFELAWPKVAVGALLLIAPLGALTGWRMRAIRRACVETKAINSELTSRLQDPFLKISLSIRLSLLFGILLLMSAKPDLWESIGIVGISVVVGFLWSLPARGQSGSLPAPSTDRGNQIKTEWKTS